MICDHKFRILFRKIIFPLLKYKYVIIWFICKDQNMRKTIKDIFQVEQMNEHDHKPKRFVEFK